MGQQGNKEEGKDSRGTNGDVGSSTLGFELQLCFWLCVLGRVT